MTTSPFSFVNYNGQQTLGSSPQVMQNMTGGASLYNQATGQNLTPQQYDQMINPSSFGARWGGAMGTATPYQAGSFDFGNGVHGTPGEGTPMAANFWANDATNASRPGGAGVPFGSAGSVGGPMNAGMSNPYLSGQATAIQNRQQQFVNNALNQINSSAGAVGGVGGTRQGVAQGQAIGMGSQGLTDSLAGLYGNAWNADQNRALSQYQGDQGFYSQQRGLDQSGEALGLNMWNLGNQGQWTPLNQANNIYGNYTGFGPQTTSGQQGGGWQGLLGGALGGATLANNMKWWG